MDWKKQSNGFKMDKLSGSGVEEVRFEEVEVRKKSGGSGVNNVKRR